MKEQLSFGEWLRKQRRALDLSRQDLADQAGCAEITLRRIETGTLKPSKELASILLEKVGIPKSESEHWMRYARGQADMPSQEQSIPDTSPQTNLPALLTSFIGREKEQAEIIKRIEKYRLVTLVGSGGVGKTRLSIKTGEQVLENYADGVWLLELASLSDPALLPQTAAALFGITTQSDISFTDLLINILRSKSALLILDNCEHLLDACAQLVDTLSKSCPHLKIIATSRESLGITGEAIYRVPSLGLPDLQTALDTFKDFESVRLFEERAKLAQFDFALTSENAASVAQICYRLDGIPLAIELAAAKVGSFSTEQIAKQLDESFNLLTGGSRTALPRHQTLRASMEWSWNLLTESEQMLMRQLAVFSGGWTLGAALAICDGDVMGLTSSLVRKSLVILIQEGRHETRYGFHEVVRQYAREKLDEFGETEQVRQCHRDFFIGFSEQAEPKLKGAQQLKWLDHLGAELDNLRAVLQWTHEVGDVEATLRLAGLLFWFWKKRGYVSEGRVWLERALAAGLALTTSARATLFYQIAYLAGAQGDFDGAREFVEQSIALWRSLDSKENEGLSLALALLAVLTRAAGNPATACSLAEESVALSREQGNAWNLALSLVSLGMALRDQEDYDLAQSTIQESVGIWRELGDLWSLAEALYSLGMIAHRRGDYEVGYSLNEEALNMLRQLGDKQSIAYCIHDLGVFALAQGNLDRARSFFEQDLILFREVGDKSGIVVSLQYQGLFAHLQGDDVQAQAFLKEGLTLAHETGPIWVSSNYLLWLAALAADRGQLERAVRLCSAADTHVDKVASFWDAFEYTHYERIMNLARISLGENGFVRAEAEGRAMPLERAVAYALEELDV